MLLDDFITHNQTNTEPLFLYKWVKTNLVEINKVGRKFKTKGAALDGHTTFYAYMVDWVVREGVMTVAGNTPTIGSIRLAIFNARKVSKVKKNEDAALFVSEWVDKNYDKIKEVISMLPKSKMDKLAKTAYDYLVEMAVNEGVVTVNGNKPSVQVLKNAVSACKKKRIKKEAKNAIKNFI